MLVLAPMLAPMLVLVLVLDNTYHLPAAVPLTHRCRSVPGLDSQALAIRAGRRQRDQPWPDRCGRQLR